MELTPPSSHVPIPDALAAAHRRLDAAVARLETLVLRLGDDHAEKRRLEAALNEARAQYAQLREVAGSIGQRLDSTILRLASALEG